MIQAGKRVWDFQEKKLLSDEADARASFEQHLIGIEESLAAARERLSTEGPYYMIRLGDTEAAHLSLPFAQPHEIDSIKSCLYFSGIDVNNIPNPQEYVEILRNADIVSCQQPILCSRYFWGPTFDALNVNHLLGQRTYHEIHTLYRLAASGELFTLLAGKRVVLLGAKAPYFFQYYYLNEHYRKTFPFLNLDKFNIVGVINTPDMEVRNMNFRHQILEDVRASYALKPDVYLCSAGLMAKYVAAQVAQDGYVGIDIGNVLESMMNWVCKRPFMEVFHEYEHPDYTFHLGDHYQLARISVKSKQPDSTATEAASEPAAV
jgi:hypothetical protein